MASLKHLLNHEDDKEVSGGHEPSLSWEDSGFFEEPDPSLPVQSWDQLIGDILGSGGLEDIYQGADVDSCSIRDTQNHIEQWAAGDNCNDVQLYVNPPHEIEEANICYGTIFRAAIRLCGNMVELDQRLSIPTASPIQGHLLLSLKKSDNQYLITFNDGTVLGEVNASLEKALSSITEQQHQLDFEVFASIKNIRETVFRTIKQKDAVIRTQINVYGPRIIGPAIGQELSQQKIYLQRPDYIRPGADYDNPHFLKLNNQGTQSVVVNIDLEEKTSEKDPEFTLKEAITGVYSSLTREYNLKGLEADARLKTTLLQHQKTALDFMTQRENGPISESYRLWRMEEKDEQLVYKHVVTNAICRLDPPDETGGGILADEMGMGKSLSVLALILRTLETAHQWAAGLDTGPCDMTQSWRVTCRSSATLIVASSDLMINEWFLELDKHFSQDTRNVLKTVKYHGQKRGDLPKSLLLEADIIITTYHTLASEFSNGKDTLRDIEWYRLVLDEAHIIRRQTTGLYRTVAGIPAKSRWCLTGTPIQNRLEDIGSLLAFLRLDPFHNLSAFRKSIAIPFDEGGKRRTLAIERFTRLLDSVCLRRTKDLLHLPDQQNHVRLVQLSPEELSQYEQTQKTMFRAVRHQNGMFDQKSTLGMFQVQLQLRILCNHGTWQQPFSWNRRKLHLLDEREALETSLGRGGEITCSACRQTLPLFGTGTMFQRYDSCRHVLCSECVDESMPQEKREPTSRCPLCRPLWNGSTDTLRSKHGSQEDTYFRSNGRSSKMDMLMADVMVDVWTTKSIIFTCWTRTLDLIQLYLKNTALKSGQFQRIDGECPTAKREKILDEFANNPDLRVLIMTTGTGAVGLNLTSANRVFIVEPQWNPSVEYQAIARALRIGQKQPVIVTRYLVNQTVEQDMRALQDSKRQRAQLVNNS